MVFGGALNNSVYKYPRGEPKPGEPQDFMWYAGYDFKMGKEAHERMFPTIC